MFDNNSKLQFEWIWGFLVLCGSSSIMPYVIKPQVVYFKLELFIYKLSYKHDATIQSKYLLTISCCLDS